jgi:hypothetical protein
LCFWNVRGFFRASTRTDSRWVRAKLRCRASNVILKSAMTWRIRSSSSRIRGRDRIELWSWADERFFEKNLNERLPTNWMIYDAFVLKWILLDQFEWTSINLRRQNFLQEFAKFSEPFLPVRF